MHLRGHVRGIFHHLERLAVEIEDRVVARLDPDLAPTLPDPTILPRIVFSAPQLLPERPIAHALTFHRINKHRMMLPDDLIERVAERCQEIRVGP